MLGIRQWFFSFSRNFPAAGETARSAHSYSLYHAGRQKATPGKIFPAGVGRSAGSMTFRPAAGHTPCPRAAGDAGNGNPIVCPSLVCGRRMLRRQIRPAVPCPKMVLRRCGSGRAGAAGPPHGLPQPRPPGARVGCGQRGPAGLPEELPARHTFQTPSLFRIPTAKPARALISSAPAPRAAAVPSTRAPVLPFRSLRAAAARL